MTRTTLPAPPLLPRPAGATWPDPTGQPFVCDADAHDALSRAEICQKHDDRRGALRYLADYEYLCECGVERPDFDSRARNVLRLLARLPKGHAVPETVATLDEFLAVLAVNQDSPRKTYTFSCGFHYNDAGRGEKVGHHAIQWRANALVNYGRDRVGGQPYNDDLIEGARLEWDGGSFARVPTLDRHGQKQSPEQKQLMALHTLRLWHAVIDFGVRATDYDWTLADDKDWTGMLTRMCANTGVDPRSTPSEVATQIRDLTAVEEGRVMGTTAPAGAKKKPKPKPKRAARK